MKILRLTNQSPEFYPLMGPFLSRRAIAKEMGGPIWDDDGKIWFVAVDRGKVAGFAAIRGNVLCSAYVLPDRRGSKVYDALLRERLTAAPAGTLRAVARKAAVGSLRRHGFKAGAKRGAFTTMTKDSQ